MQARMPALPAIASIENSWEHYVTGVQGRGIGFYVLLEEKLFGLYSLSSFSNTPALLFASTLAGTGAATASTAAITTYASHKRPAAKASRSYSVNSESNLFRRRCRAR